MAPLTFSKYIFEPYFLTSTLLELNSLASPFQDLKTEPGSQRLPACSFYPYTLSSTTKDQIFGLLEVAPLNCLYYYFLQRSSVAASQYQQMPYFQKYYLHLLHYST